MHNNNKLVSAIIVTYKRPISILKRAVESVVNQTYKNIEIIVVNDCPEDENLTNDIGKMLKNYKNINYIVHKKNMGACAARNTGIKASNGDFIALLDDDDEWLPEKIEQQLKGFISEKVGMVYSPFYNIRNEKQKVEQLCVRGTKSGDLSSNLLWKNCIGGTSMPMMRREVFDKCGFFDENLLASQDYEMWLRISQKYDIQCVNIPLTRRFMQDESITKNHNKQKQAFNYFNNKYAELYKVNKKAYNYRINRRVNKWFELRYYKDAFEIYKMALKVNLFSIYNITEPIKGLIKSVIR